jgi:hypothetical protein
MMASGRRESTGTISPTNCASVTFRRIPQRQTIAVVYYTDDRGKTTEFLASDAQPTQKQLDQGEHRVMDCLDCHNRPAHTSEMPAGAVDKQMALGRISADLPYIKKEAVEVLQGGLSPLAI